MFSFILFGTGWRAQFYTRIAQALPEHFSIPVVYTRSPERLPLINGLGFNGTTNLQEALQTPHDAVLVASGPKGLVDTLELLAERGEKIITETSFLTLSDEETARVKEIEGWTLEQYLYTPLFKAVEKAKDRIGEIHELRLAMLHNHHAASIFRHTFPSYTEGYELLSMDYPAYTVRTSTRAGRCFTGEREDYTRKLRAFKGKDWFFENDFSTNMYRSYLIPSTLELRGTRGVVTEEGISYVDGDGFVVKDKFVRHFDGDKENGNLTLSHITLLGERVYTNPFYGTLLNDDEIAMAEMLLDIAEGRCTYTIREALEDARIGKLL